MPDRKKVVGNLLWIKIYFASQAIGAKEATIKEAFVESQKVIDEAIAMLKENDVKYPVCEKCGKKIDHIITSVFNYDGSDSEHSFPITYNKDGGCVQFSTTQNWTGYELTDAEQKDGIRCPFCHEFPFDANEEIELYEPEEVVVMMREGR